MQSKPFATSRFAGSISKITSLSLTPASVVYVAASVSRTKASDATWSRLRQIGTLGIALPPVFATAEAWNTESRTVAALPWLMWNLTYANPQFLRETAAAAARPAASAAGASWGTNLISWGSVNFFATGDLLPGLQDHEGGNRVAALEWRHWRGELRLTIEAIDEPKRRFIEEEPHVDRRLTL